MDVPRRRHQNNRITGRWRRQIFAVLFCPAIILPGSTAILAATPPPAETQDPQQKIPAERLDALLAPIALYADNLLARVLVAGTYPLELIQLYQWLGEYRDREGSEKGERRGSEAGMGPEHSVDGRGAGFTKPLSFLDLLAGRAYKSVVFLNIPRSEM
jgi:hypothetical protein